MILPHSDASLIVLMIVCLLCWGSWPVLFKMAKKYRFELFYFDFGFGLFFTALILAFTVGSLGFDGFSFRDDLMNARKQEWLIALLAAMIFNFGNMLMLSAVSVAGMTVAVPISLGTAMIVAAWVNSLGQPGINSGLLVVGTLLILGSIVLNSSAYSHLRLVEYEALARAGKTKSTRRPTFLKGIVLAVIGGIVMGTFNPLLLRAQDADDGVGPYSLLFLFAIGIMVSTFVFNLFFMNLPVEGDPLEIGEYFKAAIKNHLLGFLAGAVWGAGALATFVVHTPKGDTHLTGMTGMLGQTAPIVAALWGLLFWKEYKPGGARSQGMGAAMIVLLAAGWAIFSYAAANPVKP